MSREKKDKREQEYPVQLESQFILRMPEEPGKVLGELIKSGDNFKSRCTIQIHDDLRHGELRLDHWLLQAKIVDLPTIIESWKTIDKKSLYKSADICQMMICKDKFEEIIEDESTKNKKKDPLKVDKKYLWPHGVTPPTKNVRKRRFRKTLKKKSAEAPEIEKEVKRLLRADNEALSFTWEVIGEEDGDTSKSDIKNISLSDSQIKLAKTAIGKKEKLKKTSILDQTSKEEDIFGGTLSDSDIEEDIVNIEFEDRKLSHKQTTEIKSVKEVKVEKARKPTKSEIHKLNKKSATLSSHAMDHSSYNDFDNSGPTHSGQLNTKLQELVFELEELKQRKQRTQLEISRMENMTLRQRFQDLLKTLNKEINMKEMEYNKLKFNSV